MKAIQIATLLTILLSTGASATDINDVNFPIATHPDCVAWYALNEAEGNEVFDSSGCGGTGWFTDMVWDVNITPLGTGTSLHSEGTGQLILANLEEAFDTEAITLTAWVRLAPETETGTLWSLADANQTWITCAVDSNGLLDIEAKVYSSGGRRKRLVTKTLESTIPLARGEWIHLSSTWSNTHQVFTTFMNGLPIPLTDNQQDLSDALAASSEIRFGPFTGHLDDIQVFNQALDGSKIKHTLSAPPASPWLINPAHQSRVVPDTPVTLAWDSPDPQVQAYQIYSGSEPNQLLPFNDPQTSSSIYFFHGLLVNYQSCWQVESLFEQGTVRGPVWQVTGSALNLNDVIQKPTIYPNSSIPYNTDTEPTLVLQDIDGQWHTLASERGRQVLVITWAPWCGYCVREMPHVIDLYRDLPRDRFTVWAVAIWSEEANVRAYRNALPGMYFPVFNIDKNTLPSPFRLTTGVPTNFFIDERGRVKFIGSSSNHYQDFLDILNAAWPEKAKEPPQESSRPSYANEKANEQT